MNKTVLCTLRWTRSGNRLAPKKEVQTCPAGPLSSPVKEKAGGAPPKSSISTQQRASMLIATATWRFS